MHSVILSTPPIVDFLKVLTWEGRENGQKVYYGIYGHNQDHVRCHALPLPDLSLPLVQFLIKEREALGADWFPAAVALTPQGVEMQLEEILASSEIPVFMVRELAFAASYQLAKARAAAGGDIEQTTEGIHIPNESVVIRFYRRRKTANPVIIDHKELADLFYAD